MLCAQQHDFREISLSDFQRRSSVRMREKVGRAGLKGLLAFIAYQESPGALNAIKRRTDLTVNSYSVRANDCGHKCLGVEYIFHRSE